MAMTMTVGDLAGYGPMVDMGHKYIRELQFDYSHMYMQYVLHVRTTTGLILHARLDKHHQLNNGHMGEEGLIRLVTDNLCEQPQIDHSATQKLKHQDLFYGESYEVVVKSPMGSKDIVLLGGPSNGELRSCLDLDSIMVIPEFEPMTAPNLEDAPLNAAQTTYTYVRERVNIVMNKDQDQHWSCRVMVHDSVPKDMIANLFLECLVEFPIIKIYPQYAIYFWCAKQLGLL